MDYNKLLTGKRVLITTGARGIGRDIARLFASQGAVILLGGRNQGYLEHAVKEIREISPTSKGYLMDLSDEDSMEKCCCDIIDTFGGTDILVHTAGINQRMPLHECAEADLKKMMEVNYFSGLRFAGKMLPGMMERKEGNLIFISSIHAFMTMPGNTMYAGTKGAMVSAARAMALDYASYGIRVNTICPGLILSDVVKDEIKEYPEGDKQKTFIKLLNSMQPLPPGKMRDISNTALFLASEMSSYITGQVIMADGGASAVAHPMKGGDADA